jgi:hypothetical protein
MPFSTLPNFGKVTKKVATFSLLLNFGNYKILSKFSKVENGINTILLFFQYCSD